MARAFCHEPNTAPIAPQSCSCGSVGKSTPSRCLMSGLELADELREVGGGELGVELRRRGRASSSRGSPRTGRPAACPRASSRGRRRRTSARSGGRSPRRSARSWSRRSGPATVSSLRPRFSTVSIMPGIDARAPERTETSSGFVGSPNFRPTRLSTRARCVARPAASARRVLAAGCRRSRCRRRS